MREIVLIMVGFYAVLQAYAAVMGWRQGIIRSRGALVTMLLGSMLMIAGAIINHANSILGLILIGVGLYFISDAAFYIGTQRPNGPRHSHHGMRAMVAIFLMLGLVVS